MDYKQNLAMIKDNPIIKKLNASFFKPIADFISYYGPRKTEESGDVQEDEFQDAKPGEESKPASDNEESDEYEDFEFVNEETRKVVEKEEEEYQGIVNSELLAIAAAMSIQPQMLCSSCGEMAGEKPYTCQRGHLCCLRCAVYLRYCIKTNPDGFPNRVGTEKFCKLAVYEFHFEPYNVIYRESLFYCNFVSHGCNLKIRGSALAAHVATCVFKPLKQCYYNGCGEIALFTASKHLNLKHGVPLLYDQCKCEVKIYYPQYEALLVATDIKKWDKFTWVSQIISFDDIEFNLVTQINRSNLFLSVQTNQDNYQYLYKYKITLFSDHEKVFPLTFDGHVIGPFEKDVELGEKFAVQLSTLKRMYSFSPDKIDPKANLGRFSQCKLEIIHQ